MNSNKLQMSDLTVVLNIFKRNYLKEQLQSILSQNTLPKEIWIIQIENHFSIDTILQEHPSLRHIHSSVDIKYFGRFCLAKFIKTEFTLIIDDDIIPSSNWIDTCLEKSKRYNAIVCSNGRIIPPNDYTPEVPKFEGYFQKYFVGDGINSSFNNCHTDTIVDYPCSSYFFRTEWLKFFWSMDPFSLDIGEDIHFAASCKLLGQISTVVPLQNTKFNSGNIKPIYSMDEHASWRKRDFVDKRKKVLEYLINTKNWSPLLWNQQK